MIRWVRRLHLYAGLMLLAFVVMYFFTGLLMTHEQFAPRGAPARTTSEIALSYSGPWTTRQLGLYLHRSLSLEGRLAGSSSQEDGGFAFRYANAGVQFEAIVPPTRDKVLLTRSEPTVIGTLHAMHRFHGYGGGWFYNLWAMLLDLCAIALLVFAVAGVILWYRLSASRTIGWAMLGIGLIYSGGMLLFFYTVS